MALTKEAREYFAKEGRRGGKARAANLTQRQRSEIARKAVEARWAKQRELMKEITEGSKALLKKAKVAQSRLSKKNAKVNS